MRFSISFTAIALALAASCAPSPREYDVRIRRTTHGVPHIVASDRGSLAFGQGYAFAEDNACALADQIVKVRGERARFFGRGEDDAHVDSDFAYRHLGLLERADGALSRQSEEVREMIRGYVAGYNALLEREPKRVPAPCRDQPWVRPLEERELMAYYLDLTLLGSSRQLLPLFARAAPPSSGALQHTPDFPNLRRPGAGSNGWAIGAEKSAHGGGLLLGNPHFPWEGELRLGEVHLTIPGELDVYGATLMGIVGVLLGFNENVAWTHTVSFAPRMTLYALELHPGDATAYLYDDEVRVMSSHDYTIEVLGEDGKRTKEKRTLWRSHYGPMLQMPLYGWASDIAFTFRDANLESESFLEQFRRMALAGSVEELKKVHGEVQGIPWVHTLAVDARGNALYADGSTVPKLREEVIERWLERRESDFYTRSIWELGAVLVEGHGEASEWVSDPRAARPGIIPFAEAPSLVRRDFVVNANDNHWLPNPAAPLEGYSALYGDERTPRGARTRMNLALVMEGDEPLTRADVVERLFSNRGLHAERLLPELLARCEGVSDTDVAEACTILAGFDGRYDEDARGALLFREWLGTFDDETLRAGGALYAEPFDANDPVDTPRGLAPAPAEGEDPLLLALLEARARLDEAGLAPDARLATAQVLERDGETPVHGGFELDGVANVVGQTSLSSTLDAAPRVNALYPETGLAEGGYPVDYGASFVFAVELDDDGPRAEALLVYGQSGDPGSPHYDDQLPLYGEKKLRPALFREEDIRKDPHFREERVQGSDEGLAPVEER